MEAHEEPRDPGYDDWFDEPESLTETQTAANRGAYEEVEEVWVLPDDEDARSPGQREFVIGGRTLTLTQVAIIGLSVLAIFFALAFITPAHLGDELSVIFRVFFDGLRRVGLLAVELFLVVELLGHLDHLERFFEGLEVLG